MNRRVRHGYFQQIKNTFFETTQKLWGGLTAHTAFNQVTSASSNYSKAVVDPSFDYRSFDNGVADALARNGIKNAVSASGTYRMDDHANEYLSKALMFQGQYEVATIVMSHANDGRAAAYMVGRRADGQYDVTALQNINNPHDRKYYDRESAQGSVTYFNTVFSLRGQMVRDFVETKYPNEVAQDVYRIVPNRPERALMRPAYA